MPREKSTGAIIFRKNKEIKYLLLHYGSSAHYKEHWEFIKGNIEKGEDEIKTIKREIKEETGISDVNFLPGFKEKISFFYKKEGKITYKEVIFYLVQTKVKSIKLSYEHVGYEWLNFDDALKLLKFENSKDVLTKANNFLKNKKEKQTTLRIQIDGASKGNPGPAGIGVVIFKGNKKIKEISKNIKRRTNNQVEYSAAIKALKEALKLKANKVTLITDSQLLMRQVKGYYKVKSPNLFNFYNKLMYLKRKFKNFNIIWTERKNNFIADKLAKKAAKQKEAK